MYKFRQHNNHCAQDQEILKINKTKAEVAKEMIKEASNILLATHEHLKCNCSIFKRGNRAEYSSSLLH